MMATLPSMWGNAGQRLATGDVQPLTHNSIQISLVFCFHLSLWHGRKVAFLCYVARLWLLFLVVIFFDFRLYVQTV
jgi:hypothetical protein